MPEKSASSPLALDQRIAKIAVRGLIATPVTPNMVTGASIAVGLFAAWLLAQGGVAANWGGALFVVVVWMDHVDGELARETDMTSEFGHYFDHIAAMTNYVVMFVGAGVGLADGVSDWVILFGIGSGIGVASIMSVRMYAEHRLGRSFVKQSVRAGFEIEDTLYLVAPITWLGLLEHFIYLAGVGAPLFLVYVVWDCFREIRQQGSSG